MRTHKRIMAIGAALTMMLSMQVFAANKSTAEASEDLRTISVSELPAGITPMEFDSEEDAIKYINSARASFATETFSSFPVTRSTDGNATVATRRLGVLGGSISLKLRYGTSGNGNTGTVTYLTPYTTTSGITYSFTWREDNIGADLRSNGKDVYVYTDGVIEAYLLVDGLLKLWEEPVSLSGTVAVIR